MSEVALAAWQRIAPDLHAVGLLTVLDQPAFAAFCATYGRVLELEGALRGQGMVLKTKKGYPYLNPVFTALHAELKQLRAFMTDFGMTPAARSRIQIEKPEPLSDLERFKRKHDG